MDFASPGFSFLRQWNADFEDSVGVRGADVILFDGSWQAGRNLQLIACEGDIHAPAEGRAGMGTNTNKVRPHLQLVKA